VIETVRVSEQGRDQLITLKRYTGIKNWNTLCRWAFCVSIRESSVPPNTDVVTDSSVEMTWRVFGGARADLYWALLKQRCRQDGFGTDPDTLATQFKLHLHRGIGYLMGDRTLRRIDALLAKVD
jgi:DNA sulfur modification protein DndE